jgi:hypothetical protein
MRPIAAFCLMLAVAGGEAVAREDEPTPDFNRDVRPILSEHCFGCHGPDAKARKADLRLDTREGLFRPLDGATPVVPRKPDESELYLRVTAEEDDLRMPPPKSGHALTPAQVGTIRRWIEQGAEWKGHWAYIPPTRPPVPDVKDDGGFIRNDIDRFILARLRERGLRPSPEADRVTLIRRLSFDLTGLPPLPEEVDAFLKDDAPGAYERLVERLLTSPHFGERMAISWLDLVRYADTGGYHSDNHRDVWLYRDYVIKAFNANMPFDRFTVEQLAGDLLPGPSADQKVASGYNRLLMTTEEGGAQAKEYIAKYAADRVRNASTVWMGATFGCAECHDHKYDPYRTREFYAFAAFFADLKEKAVGRQDQTPIPSPEQAARLADLDARMAPLRAALDAQTPDLDADLAAWERSRAVRKVEWTTLRPAEAVSKGGATLAVRDDGSILASGTNPERDTYTLTLKADMKGITAIRLEALPDDSLPGRGPGRASNGNFVLSEIVLSVGGEPVAWSGASASHSQGGYGVAAAIDGKPETGWAILPRAGRATEAVFQTGRDLGDGGEATLTVTMHQNYGSQHALGRFRLAATTAPRPVVAEGADALPKEVAAILEVDPDARDDAQRKALAAYYRGIAPRLEPTRRALAELQRQRAKLESAMPKTLVAIAAEPRVMRVLPRGNWLDDSGPVVEPAVPAFLPPLGVSGRRPTRLDLARWLVAPENPLTARVAVNRLWKQMFGRGLVSTLDDFGAQGAWPTHPHLLDWLAVEFRDGGWDVKRMLTLMALSGTYRQSSRADESLRRADPDNLWLARQGRFRLDAEEVRDNALAISGLLVRAVGGPSVKPYQPAGYWAHLNFPKRDWAADRGPDQYRRGLYTYWCRTFLHPSLLAFDAPGREECQVERPRSNTPLQALVLLNDPTYVEAARALAERVIRDGGDGIESRVALAYRRALSRPPRPAEAAILAALYRRHLDQYRADRKAADALLRVGDAPVPADLDPAELAAWTSVARAILNLHETITRN